MAYAGDDLQGGGNDAGYTAGQDTSDVAKARGDFDISERMGRYKGLGAIAADRKAYEMNWQLANGAQADALQARGGQMRAMGLAHGVANGGFSHAQQVGQQNLQRGLQNQQAAALSARGGSLAQAAAMRQQQGGQGAYMQAGNQQLQAQHAQEMAKARDQWMQGANAVRGMDQMGQSLNEERAQAQQRVEIGQRQLNSQGQMGYEQMAQDEAKAELGSNIHNNAVAAQKEAAHQAATQADNDRFQKKVNAGIGAFGTFLSDARTKRSVSSLSDASAKREAYALGRAHQWEQGKTGKPVEWAHEMPKDITERGEMSGDRGKVAAGGGKAAVQKYGRVVPPNGDDERAMMAARVEGRPAPAPAEPMAYRALGAVADAIPQPVHNAFARGVEAVPDPLPAERPMAPAAAPSAWTQLAGRARAMTSDERAKKAERMLGEVTAQRDAMMSMGPAVGRGARERGEEMLRSQDEQGRAHLAAGPAVGGARSLPPMTAQQKALMAQGEGMMAGNAAQSRAQMSRGPAVKSNPMTDALADGLAPHEYEYKDGFAEAEGQRSGEKNVGIMAQNAEKNPITGTIVEQDENGMRRINLKKSTSLALAAAGHNAQMLREQQAQIDKLKGGR